jgi:hypothetical protein
MKKITIRVAVALLAFLLGVSATLIYIRHKRQLYVVIPMKWERYGLQVLDERANAAKLQKLRTVLLPAGDLEVRVWIGFGTGGEDGLILRRAAGEWSALHIHGMFERYPPEKYQETFSLAVPKSGWERAWQRLVDAGILALPDESTLECGPAILDGIGYAVETNMDEAYRLYSYGNPQYAKCGEAKRMMEIGRIISEEFGLEEFSIND